MIRPLVSLLPGSFRSSVRAWHHRRQMALGWFRSPEPEWDRLGEWLRPGDTAVDVGANVGHYTSRMSQLVGKGGRVFAFEPVPATFAALASNCKHFPFPNVTLLNTAVGDGAGLVGMRVPGGADGSYLARVDPTAELKCLAVSVDMLDLPGPVRLVKIDAEGYEPRILAGMANLLTRDRPVVILERNAEAERVLDAMGYTLTRSPGPTPNVVAVCR